MGGTIRWQPIRTCVPWRSVHYAEAAACAKCKDVLRQCRYQKCTYVVEYRCNAQDLRLHLCVSRGRV